MSGIKVAILIPSTTKERPWKNIKETDLYKINLKSFLLTYDPEHTYTYYVGIDNDDPLYSKESERKELLRFISVMKNVSLQFISLQGIKKGHLTVMWNRLFHKAYHDGYDYFYQCGDDIQFINKGWVSKSIKLLRLYHNLGCTGPHDKMQYRVHTQSFVSRKHYEIFKFYFPPEIINWFCDDWITKVYWEDLLYPLLDKWCMNCGGAPRYINPHYNHTYDKQKILSNNLIARDRKKLAYILQESGLTFPKSIMLQEQYKMKIGFKENEKKYDKLVNNTHTAVMNSVKKQKDAYQSTIQKIIQQKKIIQSTKPPSLLNALKTTISHKKAMGLLIKD